MLAASEVKQSHASGNLLGASLKARIAALGGWRRNGLATLLGALSVLAMAPFFLWPVLFVTLPGLVLLIDGTRGAAAPDDAQPASVGQWPRFRQALRKPAWRAFAAAWYFGFGYHFAGLFWIGEAFLVEAEVFAVLLPFAVTLMPAGLALFWGAAAAISFRFWQPGLVRVLGLALTLSAAEWLRGHILTGFPWNILGYALTWPDALMQTASVFGIYGLTFLAVLIFAMPGTWLADRERWPTTSDGGRAVLIAVVPLLALYALGSALARAPLTPDTSATPIRIRVVQPSVPQREKWQPENQERIFTQHLELSHRDMAGAVDGAKGVALIVWPEAAMPFVPLRYPSALAAIGRMLPEGTHLASGALRIDETAGQQAPSGRRVYNSLLVFGDGGRLAATYDKIHLVPFGEYLPLQTALEAIGLQQLSRLRGGFAAGVRPRPLLTIPGLPKLGPLVCYEAIFPGTIVQGAERPGALINVTNDGWFGNTTGPRQHLHQARVRAVEEGIPILRAANNGISAIIDARGHVVAFLGMNAIGVVDGLMPPTTLKPPIYARLGDSIFALMLALGLVIALLIRSHIDT